MFKKILIFVVVAFLGLALLGACSGDSTEDTGSGSATEQKQEANNEQKKSKLTVEGDIETTIEYDTPKLSGIVKNNTDSEMGYVEIQFTLYDENDVQIGTALDNTNNLKAGGSWKFEAISLDNISEFDHYEYEVSGF